MLAVLATGWLLICTSQLTVAATLRANPSDYRALLDTLQPGDTLALGPGTYSRLNLIRQNGTPEAWITIQGPPSGPPAVIAGEPGHNTIEILDSSYVAIENLRIDSRGIPGAFGISARHHEDNLTHHIRIEGNTLVGQNASQQTDGISTKTPTWGWVIRYNRIIGAGTGIYLGESDGTQPFVAGIVEHNLIQDTIGYNMEIKDQVQIPAVPGMPLTPTTTIIRNNVFIKNDQRSPDGDRPNLLVGAFPASDAGSLNMYEIYGNYFFHNHREALFQGSGRVSLHDNIFVDGPFQYAAVVLRRQNWPLQIAHVYNNTVYTSGRGIYFGTGAMLEDAVIGNLVFASKPISGPIGQQKDNLVDTPENASQYVRTPSFEIGIMDFYPLAGKCQGAPIDLSLFRSNEDYTRDFNGDSKTAFRDAVVFRGAYSGEGDNPGWQLQRGVRPPHLRAPHPLPSVVWISPAQANRGMSVQVTLTGANFSPGSSVMASGDDIRIGAVRVDDTTQVSASLMILPNAEPGLRDLTVSSPAGRSNTVRFRIRDRPR